MDDIIEKPQSDIDETENKANNAAELIDDGFVQEDADKMINNAAEEVDGHKFGEKKGLRHDEMDLELGIVNRVGIDQKLDAEIAGDHGAGYPEDLHMIEGQQDDDLGDG